MKVVPGGSGTDKVTTSEEDRMQVFAAPVLHPERMQVVANTVCPTEAAVCPGTE
jgi:hypothetical protein